MSENLKIVLYKQNGRFFLFTIHIAGDFSWVIMDL